MPTFAFAHLSHPTSNGSPFVGCDNRSEGTPLSAAFQEDISGKFLTGLRKIQQIRKTFENHGFQFSELRLIKSSIVYQILSHAACYLKNAQIPHGIRKS